MGRAPALPVMLKWQQRDEEGDALLVASKRKQEYDGEGQRPPRRVKMATTRRGGACPSLSH